MIGALWESIRFVLVFNPIPRQLFHTYIFLLSLLNHLLVTEKLERLKGRGYSIYDVKFDRRAQSCVPAQIWGKQENDYFKQFRCRSKFEFTIGCLCSNMNTTREVVFQALSKHLEADRKLYLQSHSCAQIWRQWELMFETISKPFEASWNSKTASKVFQYLMHGILLQLFD